VAADGHLGVGLAVPRVGVDRARGVVADDVVDVVARRADDERRAVLGEGDGVAEDLAEAESDGLRVAVGVVRLLDARVERPATPGLGRVRLGAGVECS